MTEAPSLYQRNVDLVEKVSAGFFLPGSDRDDLLQEARYALWDACRCYRPERGVTFRTFASRVIRKQLVSKVIVANRGKHLVLTRAIREGRNDEGDLVPILDLLADLGSDPADVLVAREEFDRVVRVVCDDLSPLERRAVIGFANGLSYAEIEGVHDAASVKQVDNALSRARKKLREAA